MPPQVTVIKIKINLSTHITLHVADQLLAPPSSPLVLASQPLATEERMLYPSAPLLTKTSVPYRFIDYSAPHPPPPLGTSHFGPSPIRSSLRARRSPSRTSPQFLISRNWRSARCISFSRPLGTWTSFS